MKCFISFQAEYIMVISMEILDINSVLYIHTPEYFRMHGGKSKQCVRNRKAV